VENIIVRPSLLDQSYVKVLFLPSTTSSRCQNLSLSLQLHFFSLPSIKVSVLLACSVGLSSGIEEVVHTFFGYTGSEQKKNVLQKKSTWTKSWHAHGKNSVNHLSTILWSLYIKWVILSVCVSVWPCDSNINPTNKNMSLRVSYPVFAFFLRIRSIYVSINVVCDMSVCRCKGHALPPCNRRCIGRHATRSGSLPPCNRRCMAYL
jgi:hypothetical protein